MGKVSRRARSALMVVTWLIVGTVVGVVVIVGVALGVSAVFQSAGAMVSGYSPLPDRVEHNGRSYVQVSRHGCDSDTPDGASPAFEIFVLFGDDLDVYADDRGPNVPTDVYVESGGCYVAYSLEGGP